MIKLDKLKKTMLVLTFFVSTGSLMYANSGDSSIKEKTINSFETIYQQKSNNSQQIVFGVRGSCGMCKERIERAAISTPGVKSAQWDQAKQVIRLQIDQKKTSADVVAKAIAKAGHDTDKYKADQKTYNELPGCCQYRSSKK